MKQSEFCTNIAKSSFRSTHGRTIHSFTGIPYAESPTGDLRFSLPVPKKKWDGVLEANKDIDCPQVFTLNNALSDSETFSLLVFRFQYQPFLRAMVGIEDCLVVNVYTTELPNGGSKGRGKPVMVWIHGGGFSVGGGNKAMHGPEFIMDYDVVRTI